MYGIDYTGELLFKNELTASQLSEVKKFLGEDCRDHPEWNAKNVTFIDLEFNNDSSGLRWDGAEKGHDMDEAINIIISHMKKKYPDFELSGIMDGTGYGEVCRIDIRDGLAVEEEFKATSEECKCPDCVLLLEKIESLENEVDSLENENNDLTNEIRDLL